MKKKAGKNSMTVKPANVKNHMWVFVNSLIENPTFDSQTKETMTLQAKSFGSKCDLSEKFMKEAQKCGIVENVLSWVQFKQTQQKDKIGGKKTSKLKVLFILYNIETFTVFRVLQSLRMPTRPAQRIRAVAL